MRLVTARVRAKNLICRIAAQKRFPLGRSEVIRSVVLDIATLNTRRAAAITSILPQRFDVA